MKVIETNLNDAFVIEPTVYEDERGFFFESFNYREFEKVINQKIEFVQDNHSRSIKNVLRGMHYQIEHPQGKLVRCVQGEVFDVAVDLRRNSSTFGDWYGVILNEKNKRQLWIPEGFAHGFYVLSDVAEFLYKTTDYRYPEAERSLRWNDEDIGVEWPLSGEPILSLKDKIAATFDCCEKY